jgi:hypothetical protein
MSKKPQDRWIVGKTIESIRSERFLCELRGWRWDLCSIGFTDGSFITLQSEETEDHPYVSHSYYPATWRDRVKS